MPQLNHEVLMRTFDRVCHSPVELRKWKSVVSLFIGEQDVALRECREALRQALEQAARDKAQIEQLRVELEEYEDAPRE